MKTNSSDLREKYSRYIVDSRTEAFGNCEEVCREIAKKQAELRLVRGHYYCSVWGERMHWWLEDWKGNVFDPTAVQFPSKGNGVYVEWDDSQPEPIGICRQCGEYIFDHEGSDTTHKKCAEAYKSYVLGSDT